MLHRSRSKDHGISTPGPTNFSKRQMGDFLTDLRSNRPPRPNGSRPPPSSTNSRQGPESRSSTSSGSIKALGHSRSSSSLSFHRDKYSSLSGRDSPEKLSAENRKDVEERLAEKEQSHAVRLAMEAMNSGTNNVVDISAQREAVELVMKHQRQNKPYRAPEALDGYDSKQRPVTSTNRHTLKRMSSQHEAQESEIGSPIKDATNGSIRRRSSKRRSFGSIRKTSINKKTFPNDSEKIWQDEKASRQQVESVEKPTYSMRSRRNPFARPQSTSTTNATTSVALSPQPTLERVEIQRNPPSKSRDPAYLSNASSSTEIRGAHPDDTTAKEEVVRFKDGVEVRGDDIRAATSRSLRDRSPNLPSPAFVSDSPERPIVSFKKDWKPSETTSNGTSPTRHLDKMASAPAVPTLRDMEEVSRLDTQTTTRNIGPPTIQINGNEDADGPPESGACSAPAIQINDEGMDCPAPPTQTPSSNIEPEAPDSVTVTPTPKPRTRRVPPASAPRPAPHHAATAPLPTQTSRYSHGMKSK